MTIPLAVRKALGIEAGAEVDFELDGNGARLVVGREAVDAAIRRLRGAGQSEMTTDEILALTRR